MTKHQHLLSFLLLESLQLPTILKKPAEKSTNVNITEEPLTSVPLVEIEDEEDENMNDKIAPIFQINKLKTTTESTKVLISTKKAPDKQTKSTSSIYCN